MSEFVNPPATAEVPTPMQRDRATTIFERSVPGRRAAAIPASGVPGGDVPIDELAEALGAAVRVEAGEFVSDTETNSPERVAR